MHSPAQKKEERTKSSDSAMRCLSLGSKEPSMSAALTLDRASLPGGRREAGGERWEEVGGGERLEEGRGWERRWDEVRGGREGNST